MKPSLLKFIVNLFKVVTYNLFIDSRSIIQHPVPLLRMIYLAQSCSYVPRVKPSRTSIVLFVSHSI